MTTPPVAAIKIHLLFQKKTSNFLEIRIRNRLTSSTLKRKHSSRTQFFLIKRPSQSSLDCSKPSTTTTTPKSDSSSNHPELHHLLHRSPHDNRSLCDDRLHHRLHLLNLTVNDTNPVYIAISVDNDTKVTIQNNIFYPLDLEEHLLQLQHGDP